MISESSILSKLQSYVGTSAGKQRMKDYLKTARKTGKQLASGESIASVEQMKEMADALADIIRSKLPDSIARVGDTLTASTPVENEDGSYEVVLRFDNGSLHRDSLDNDYIGYDGIDNIVALFNNGYHARNYTYGWWDNHKPSGEALSRSLPGDNYAWVRSKKDREPLHFMQEAVDEFNSAYGTKYDVVVQLGTDYMDE